MTMESNPQNSNKQNLTPEEQKKRDKEVRIKEFGMLRSHMNKSGLPKTSFSLQKPLQELVQQKPMESTLIDNDSLPEYKQEDWKDFLDEPFYSSKELSPELIEEGLKYKDQARNKASDYQGPTPEELIRRNILIKSIQMDQDFITSKKIFIQELIKQGDPKSLEEVAQLRKEVEQLEAQLLVDRKKVKESIISVIDELEETAPGLKEELAREQKTLEAIDTTRKERDLIP